MYRHGRYFQRYENAIYITVIVTLKNLYEMDKYQRNYKKSKLTKELIENLNSCRVMNM